MPSPADQRPRLAVVAPPALLCVAAIVLTGWFRESSSITYDETFYLGAGVKSLHDGRLDPDLWSHGAAPLAILVDVVPAVWWSGAPARSEAWVGSGDRLLITGPRLVSTLATLVPLIVLAFGWLNARRGALAATVGAGMLAFSPSLLAHASLATNDAAFAYLATLAILLMGRWLTAPTLGGLAFAAIATGLAFSSKYTGALLVPCFVIARVAGLVRECRGDGEGWSIGRRAIRSGLEIAAFLAIGFVTAWACHGFQVQPGRTWFGLPKPAFVQALEIQLLHDKIGHPSFFLGERSLQGWRLYHPFTMLVKSTIPELILAAAGLWLAARGLWRREGGRPDRERALPLLFVVILVTALVRSRISIGHRYTLALYPPIVLLTVDSLAKVFAGRPAWRLWGAALVAGQCATAVLAAPDYLSYFNPLGGGPDRAWRWLADSNIDWGQGLPALREVIEREGLRNVALDYFGTASPAEYGVSADPIGSLRRPLDEYEALAVSITKLHSAYPRTGESNRAIADVHRELRNIPPTYRAGRSIFVYDLRRPETRAAFVAAVETITATQAAALESSRSRP